MSKFRLTTSIPKRSIHEGWFCCAFVEYERHYVLWTAESESNCQHY